MGYFSLSFAEFPTRRTTWCLKGFPAITIFLKLWYQFSGWIHCFGPYGWYLLGYYLYICKWNLSLEYLAMTYFSLIGSNSDVLESFMNKDDIIIFTLSHSSLSYIYELVLDTRAQAPRYTLSNAMWDILRLHHRRVRVSLCLDYKYGMIQRVKIIRTPCRIIYASYIP